MALSKCNAQAMDDKWEFIGNNSWRLKVPGGWLVRTTIADGAGAGVHQIFIQDSTLTPTWKLADK